MKKASLILFAVLLTACVKKNIGVADQISPKDIKGMVYNNCTDSGLAGVDVYFETFYEEKITSKVKTTSGQNGEFTFPAASIHSDELYTYAVHIDSKSGTNATIPSNALFNGTTMYFNRDEATVYLKPSVTPGFLYLYFSTNIKFPIKSPDSIYVYFSQQTFHKNVPDLPFGWIFSNPMSLGVTAGNYPMGWWKIDSQKWHNGTYTHSTDSLYLGWGDVKTYTLNW
jgi:hypothetical protein